MKTEILYHGTNGDNILEILNSGTMSSTSGKVFFAKHRWESVLMHGADRTRKASFVIKVNVKVPNNVVRYAAETPGVGLSDSPWKVAALA